MDIRNIADKGTVDRVSDHSERQKTVVLQPQPRVARDADHATISASGRDTLAAVEGLAERARQQGSERSELVEAARQKLVDGSLGTPEAIEQTARTLLESDFLAG
ncbi:MAG: hypothetical protein NXI31_04565 [bacterium]|nr:hypothetical protein [bacterium]